MRKANRRERSRYENLPPCGRVKLLSLQCLSPRGLTDWLTDCYLERASTSLACKVENTVRIYFGRDSCEKSGLAKPRNLHAVYCLLAYCTVLFSSTVVHWSNTTTHSSEQGELKVIEMWFCTRLDIEHTVAPGLIFKPPWKSC